MPRLLKWGLPQLVCELPICKNSAFYNCNNLFEHIFIKSWLKLTWGVRTYFRFVTLFAFCSLEDTSDTESSLDDLESEPVVLLALQLFICKQHHVDKQAIIPDPIKKFPQVTPKFLYCLPKVSLTDQSLMKLSNSVHRPWQITKRLSLIWTTRCCKSHAHEQRMLLPVENWSFHCLRALWTSFKWWVVRVGAENSRAALEDPGQRHSPNYSQTVLLYLR